MSLILALAVLLSAPAVAQNPNAADALTANPVYQSHCAKCHGKTAEGRFMAGPSLRSEKAVALSADDLRDIITKGKHRMPKFEGKLSAIEIDELVNQIRAQAKQK